MIISKSYTFDAAHVLWRDDWPELKNAEVFGKCSHLHGHTYTVDIRVEGDIDWDTGMVINYNALDKYVKPIVERLDHAYLGSRDVPWARSVLDVLPTAENIAEYLYANIFYRLPAGIEVVRVLVRETARTGAIWKKGILNAADSL